MGCAASIWLRTVEAAAIMAFARRRVLILLRKELNDLKLARNGRAQFVKFVARHETAVICIEFVEFVDQYFSMR